MIPPFLPDGRLPEGLHIASEGEMLSRFATGSRRSAEPNPVAYRPAQETSLGREHLFAAEDRRDWDDWIGFFSRTIDPTVRKGLVEVTL